MYYNVKILFRNWTENVIELSKNMGDQSSWNLTSDLKESICNFWYLTWWKFLFMHHIFFCQNLFVITFLAGWILKHGNTRWSFYISMTFFSLINTFLWHCWLMLICYMLLYEYTWCRTCRLAGTFVILTSVELAWSICKWILSLYHNLLHICFACLLTMDEV